MTATHRQSEADEGWCFRRKYLGYFANIREAVALINLQW
jgi:hypothetical protein